MTIRIDRCVCTDQTFVSLLALARGQGLSIDELGCRTGAGKQCTMCLPYLRASLETGQTTFHELLATDEDADVIERY